MSLLNPLAELLIGYGVCTEEKEARELSDTLFRGLVTVGLILAGAEKDFALLDTPVTIQKYDTDVVNVFVKGTANPIPDPGELNHSDRYASRPHGGRSRRFDDAKFVRRIAHRSTQIPPTRYSPP